MANEKPESISFQTPYSLALVVCDFVWRDPGTGKLTLLGTFSVINARQFPAVQPIMAVYGAMTDGRGKLPMIVKLVDVDNETEPLATAETECNFEDPRTVVEFVVHMLNVSFPAPGEYRFQLFCKDEFMLERRLIVNQLSQPPQSSQSPPEE